MTPPQEQAMTDTEQWAEDLLTKVREQHPHVAISTLQAAFAEREAELVGALQEIIRKFDAAPDAVRNVPLGIMRARAALKSREAGHGN